MRYQLRQDDDDTFIILDIQDSKTTGFSFYLSRVLNFEFEYSFDEYLLSLNLIYESDNLEDFEALLI